MYMNVRCVFFSGICVLLDLRMSFMQTYKTTHQVLILAFQKNFGEVESFLLNVLNKLLEKIYLLERQFFDSESNFILSS